MSTMIITGCDQTARERQWIV